MSGKRGRGETSSTLRTVGSSASSFVTVERRLAVARRERHQACLRRSARNRSARSERTKPFGTTRRSSCADARVERATARLIAARSTTRRSTIITSRVPSGLVNGTGRHSPSPSDLLNHIPRIRPDPTGKRGGQRELERHPDEEGRIRRCQLERDLGARGAGCWDGGAVEPTRATRGCPVDSVWVI